MTNDIHAALPRHPRHLSRDTSVFLLSVCFTLVGAVLGYGASLLTWKDTVSVAVTVRDVYADCQLPIEYAVRAATLTRPILIETALVWISAYVSFEKPLLSFLFGRRGFSLGAALFALTSAKDTPLLAIIPFAYAIITAIFLLLTRFIRKEKQNAPLTETSVYALIAGGISATVLLILSLLL